MSSEGDNDGGIRWLPLESNPEVMNQFIQSLGVGSSHQFFDVFGFDPDLLTMVPQPVVATLLLFPIEAAHEAFSAEEAKRIETDGQKVADDLFYMKQYIGNACGTIGILHALGNNTDKLEIGDGPLKEYLDAAKKLNADDAAKLLETSDGISVAHEESAQEGQTEAPDLEDSVDLHFIAFVEKGGDLYELDGRKDGPVNHGPTSADSILQDSVKVVQQFMARNPGELRFNLVALAKQ